MKMTQRIAIFAMAALSTLTATAAMVTLRLDTRTAPIVADSIAVTYDASWIGGDGSAMVVISDNGVEVRRTTGTGEFTHQIPSGSGRHDLIYTTFIYGVSQEEVYRVVVCSPDMSVTLDPQGGSGGTAGVTATYGSAMPSITLPTRTGYTFGGYYTSTGGSGTQYYTASGASARNWDKTADTTLYAKWTAKTATVTLSRQGGSGGTASVTATYDCAMPTITVPTRTGYTFGGYFTSTDGSGTQYYTSSGASARNWDTTAATTLYAKWTANEYRVSFDATGGVVDPTSKMVTFDAVYGTLPTLVREPYVFVDWRLNGATVEAETFVTTPSNHVLSARWGVAVGNGIWEETICDEPISLGAQIVAPSGEVVIPSEIDGRQVVKIGADTFAGNSRITSITIPASVTNIAEGAFAGCTGIRSVSVASLFGCEEFTELFPELADTVERVSFLDGVANIPDNFFEGCTALREIDIAESVVEIGTNVFEACSTLATTEADGLVFYQGWVLGFAEGGAPGGRALPDLVIPASHGGADGSGSRPYPVRGIAAGAFRGEWGIATVELPESLVFIGAGAFENCTGLEDVAVPTNVWKIDRDAFRNCTYAQGLSLPEGALKVIGDGAFANGSSFPGIALPDGVGEVGDGAFSNCWRAASVVIPQSVERIGDDAFADCRRVAGATVPLHVRPMTELFPAAYDRIGMVSVAELGGAPGELALPGDGNDAPEDGSGAPGGRALPEDLVSSHQIVPGMFAGCAALEGVALPEWVRNVPDGAFEGCAAMEAIALPGAVTNVGTRAFADCASLQGVALPSGLESVSDGAFAGCAALAEIAFPGRMGRLGSGIFSGCANLRFARFAGNAPDFESANGGPYAGAPAGFFSYVEKGSTGWDGVATSRTLPEHWPMDTAFEIRFWDPDAAFAALDAGTMPFVTCGGGDWAEDSAESVVGGSSLRSGYLPKAEDSGRTNTTLRTTVSGTGTVSFWWKVGCEPEDADYDEWYDYAAFSVDGEESGRIAGDSGWARVSCDISGPGPHVLEWTFTRDDYDEPGADWPNCLWVDAVEWTMTGATLAEAVDAPALAFTIGGAEDWDVDAMNGWTNGVSAKSGAVANGEASWIETTVDGAGTLAFRWKVMGGLFRNTPFAYAKVEIDGMQAVSTHLTDGWEGQALEIAGAGTHTVRWTYLRTSARDCDGDCAWLDGVSWTPLATPANTETQTTPEPVPYSWLEADAAAILAAHGGDYEAAATATAANGMNKVWECYVAGISPTNAAARFEATIEMGADGKPVVTWTPPLAPEEEAKRMRKVLGKRTLVPTEDWVDVTDEADPDAAGYRFFKVKVEMK